MSTTRPWVLIGVPTSAGAHHAGQERAPAALREAGFLGRLRAAGITITDGGAPLVVGGDAAGFGPQVRLVYEDGNTDLGELPLANYPHYDSGVTAAAAFACLRELCQAGTPSGLVLTEVNPTHDPFGDLLGRYIDGVVSALAPG